MVNGPCLAWHTYMGGSCRALIPKAIGTAWPVSQYEHGMAQARHTVKIDHILCILIAVALQLSIFFYFFIIYKSFKDLEGNPVEKYSIEKIQMIHL